ncbi:MAG: SPFH domain-containing protein [Treponema sp.]|nr:SPFH domain-containing protein [Treponema sp.]
MKKRGAQVIWSLIIIILAAGAVFGLGYTNFRVPSDSVGIVVSKTGGVNSKPVTAGTFCWNWEFLLPTNASVKVFPAKSYSATKVLSGELPSGKLYSQQLKDNPDFNYSAEFSVTVKADSSKIVELLKASRITESADLDKWYESQAEEIINSAMDEILKAVNDSSVEKLDFAAISENVKTKNTKDGLEVVSFGISKTKFPDAELYRYCKKTYSEYNAIVDRKIEELASVQAQDIAANNRNLRKLEAFAKVLKEHPELSEFLKNSKDMNETLKAISSFN